MTTNCPFLYVLTLNELPHTPMTAGLVFAHAIVPGTPKPGPDLRLKSG